MSRAPERVLALRAVFRTVGSVAPETAARWAETIFCTPPRHERRNLELRLQARWDDLHLPTIVRGLRTPALLVHDRQDPDVPFHHAEEIAEAWPGARIVATEGLGHRAVLRDPAVVRSTAAFLREVSAP